MMSVLLPILLMAAVESAPTVAILPLSKGAGSEEYAGLGKALAGMITTDLSTVEALQLVERERLDELLKEIKLGKSGFIEKKTAQKLGKGLGARFMVTGSYSVVGKTFLMDARVVSVESGKILKAANAKGTVEDFVAVEKTLVETLLDGLSVKLSASTRRKLIVQAPTESFQAFSAYGEGLDKADSGKADEAKAAFERALALDPKFEAARTALASLSNLLAVERKKDRDSRRRITAAAHAAILETYPDERTRKPSYSDNREDIMGLALRLVALDNEEQYCQRFEEMMHFLDRRKWKLPEVDRRFERDAKKIGEGLGYKPLKEDGARWHLDEDLSRRVHIMSSVYDFVIGGWGFRPWGVSGEGMLSSMRGCYPDVKRQLKVIDQLYRKAKKAGVLDTVPKYGMRFTLAEGLDLAWIWTQAYRLGANAEVERRTKRLLAGRPAADKTRELLLKTLDDIENDAKDWAAHRAKQLGMPNETLRRAMIGVAKADPKVVRAKDPVCQYLARMAKSQAHRWVLELEKKKDWRAQQYHYDTAGLWFSPLRDMGCLTGIPPRFGNAKEVLDYGRSIRNRATKDALENEQCVTWLGTFDAYPWDQYVSMMDSNPQAAAGMVYGILTSRYQLLANECVKN